MPKSKEPIFSRRQKDPTESKPAPEPQGFEYRFQFAKYPEPSKGAVSTYGLMLFLPIDLYRADPSPDHLCSAFARTLKALCRPTVVANLAQALDSMINSKAFAEPTNGGLPLSVAGTTQKPAQTPVAANQPADEIVRVEPFIDVPDPLVPYLAKPANDEVEITPAGTKLTQIPLDFDTQPDQPNKEAT